MLKLILQSIEAVTEKLHSCNIIANRFLIFLTAIALKKSVHVNIFCNKKQIFLNGAQSTSFSATFKNAARFGAGMVE
jgi:hypothetical protein